MTAKFLRLEQRRYFFSRKFKPPEFGRPFLKLLQSTHTDLAIVPGPEKVMRTLSVSGVDGLFEIVGSDHAPSST